MKEEEKEQGLRGRGREGDEIKRRRRNRRIEPRRTEESEN